MSTPFIPVIFLWATSLSHLLPFVWLRVVSLLVHRSVMVLSNPSFARVQKHGGGERHIVQEPAWVGPCITSLVRKLIDFKLNIAEGYFLMVLGWEI